MNTPICDFLREYSKKDAARLHMPGHKGRPPFLGTELPYSSDITEISGADSLFEARGIIKESEENAARLFGTEETCYSAGGSTLCIQAMLAIAKRDGRRIVAVRNVHRAFISACALLDIEPFWIYPKYSGGILSGSIPLEETERAVCGGNVCLYVTSPDYLGGLVDIAALSKICKRHGAILIVDNAHGAHTAFTGGHPISLGADMCCDSAHKMLPALTGAAYLHIGNKRFCGMAKQAMALFGSTSPSYPILASLDLCNRYIAEKINDDLARILPEITALRERISSKYELYGDDPFHLTLICDGDALAGELRKRNIECEYSDKRCILLLLSPMTSRKELERLEKALAKIKPLPPSEIEDTDFPIMESCLSIKEAALSPYETIPVESSLGRICAQVNVPCPPAVPIAVSGEKINDECIKIFKKYGISEVNVVQ